MESDFRKRRGTDLSYSTDNPAADAAAVSERNIASLMEDVLRQLGENPAREGLSRTPERVEKALKYLTGGYGQDIQAVVNGALFTVKYDEMVIVGTSSFSACASTTCCRSLARSTWPICRGTRWWG